MLYRLKNILLYSLLWLASEAVYSAAWAVKKFDNKFIAFGLYRTAAEIRSMGKIFRTRR